MIEKDNDPVETQEWLDSISSVIEHSDQRELHSYKKY